jgi:hypothetical protein
LWPKFGAKDHPRGKWGKHILRALKYYNVLMGGTFFHPRISATLRIVIKNVKK